MRYPEFLKENDTIGCIAPSFGCTREPYYSAFENARKKLGELGFSFQLGPNCYASDGIGISSTPINCAKELNEYYADPANQALMTCGGGELMCEILPYVDFDRIREGRPKWLMGFSDVTNFTFLSATLCDTAAIYGPNIGAFGMEPWHPAVEEALELLMGKRSMVHEFDKWELEGLKDKEHPLLPYNCTEPMVLRRFPDQDIAVTGRILGGNLDCLSNLCGTRFDQVKEFNERYREDGIIWVLEACDLTPLGIRRALWKLRYAGWFDTAKAFLIGRPYIYGTEELGLDQYEAVLGVLRDLGKPILMDADIGHLPPMMPMVIGCTAELKNLKNSLRIVYTWK